MILELCLKKDNKFLGYKLNLFDFFYFLLIKKYIFYEIKIKKSKFIYVKLWKKYHEFYMLSKLGKLVFNSSLSSFWIE